MSSVQNKVKTGLLLKSHGTLDEFQKWKYKKRSKHKWATWMVCVILCSMLLCSRRSCGWKIIVDDVSTHASFEADAEGFSELESTENVVLYSDGRFRGL